MNKLIKVTLWKDEYTIWLLDINKMKAKGINPDPVFNVIIGSKDVNLIFT